MDQEKIKQAGEIASKTVEHAKSFIEKGQSLKEIAEKIEAKIVELGGKPAFPVTTSINEVAAHFTPSPEDESKAHGLLKIDLGVHIDGWIADTAFSLDLENNKENKKLIQTAEKALEEGFSEIQEGVQVSQIGKKVQETIESEGLLPITNLSGHSIDQYNLHSGVTIPNNDDGSTDEIDQGQFAIEPFVTTGSANGKIYEGKPSGIYVLEDDKKPRSPIAREVLQYVLENYQTLPFCSRWLVKEFGKKAILGLRQLESNGNLHHYGMLIESSGHKVTQKEYTFIVNEEGKPEKTTNH
ncbi:MAG: type II methionyl aminopeptidase [Candidatus Pacearchaeota archaeon]